MLTLYTHPSVRYNTRVEYEGNGDCAYTLHILALATADYFSVSSLTLLPNHIQYQYLRLYRIRCAWCKSETLAHPRDRNNPC